MALVFEKIDGRKDVSEALRTVIVGAFTVLGSLQLRELVSESLVLMYPESAKQKLLMTAFVTALVFLIVVVLAVVWK